MTDKITRGARVWTMVNGLPTAVTYMGPDNADPVFAKLQRSGPEGNDFIYRKDGEFWGQFITASTVAERGQTVIHACGRRQRAYMTHAGKSWCDSCRTYEAITGRVQFSTQDYTRDAVSITMNTTGERRSWLGLGGAGGIAIFHSPNGLEYAICIDHDGIPRTFQRCGNTGDYMRVSD